MDPVVIGTRGASLTVMPARRDPAGYVELLEVVLKGPGLHASLAIYAGWEAGFEELTRYFADLERDFEGWDGERVFESVEQELRLVATHDGHVRLGVQLWRYLTDSSWSAETTVVLDAGEELSRAARDLAATMRPPRTL